MGLIDSHCHLDRIDLSPYQNSFNNLIQETLNEGVEHMLCVSIDLESYPAMVELIEDYPQISISVGVHPNDKDRREPTVAELVKFAQHSKNVAIGETGLDYYYVKEHMAWQQDRFRTHVRAARECNKPLIIHTRDAREDTIRILREEKAHEVAGVMHCFTESWEMAQQALEMDFYISFSGIVTFKNATELREVASKVPLERILIETDSPYLAPVPFRGKSNEPRYVAYVAAMLADLRGIPVDEVIRITTENFYRLFPVKRV